MTLFKPDDDLKIKGMTWLGVRYIEHLNKVNLADKEQSELFQAVYRSHNLFKVYEILEKNKWLNQKEFEILTPAERNVMGYLFDPEKKKPTKIYKRYSPKEEILQIIYDENTNRGYVEEPDLIPVSAEWMNLQIKFPRIPINKEDRVRDIILIGLQLYEKRNAPLERRMRTAIEDAFFIAYFATKVRDALQRCKSVSYHESQFLSRYERNQLGIRYKQKTLIPRFYLPNSEEINYHPWMNEHGSIDFPDKTEKITMEDVIDEVQNVELLLD